MSGLVRISGALMTAGVALMMVISCCVWNGMVKADDGMYAQDWPMWRHDNLHTGATTGKGPSTNNTIWTFTAGKEFLASPSVSGGRVFVGNNDNKFYCLDATDGTMVWNFTGSGAFFGTPTVVGGSVLVGCNDYYLYCLDEDGYTDSLDDGIPDGHENNSDIVWKKFFGYAVVSSASFFEGKLYIGCNNGTLYCLNAQSGVPIWEYTVSSGMSIYEIQSSPALFGDLVIFGSHDDKVHCLNKSTLPVKEEWNFTTGNNVISSPTISNNRVFVGSDDHKIYALPLYDPNHDGVIDTGEVLWSKDTTQWVRDSPAVAGGKVYVGSSGEWGLTKESYLYCLDEATGAESWKFPIPILPGSTEQNGILSSVAVASNGIYINAWNCNVYCVDFSGNLVWSYGVEKSTTGMLYGSVSSPCIADGKCFAASYKGVLYCFEDKATPELGLVLVPVAGIMMILAIVTWYRKK